MDQGVIHILIVDDDPSLLAVLETCLQQLPGCAITAVGDAREAVQLLRTEAYHLLLTDYSLDHPEINGLTLLQQARQRDPESLIIIITAFASLELTLQSIQLGAFDFLTKPFQLDELQLVVRNALDRLRLQRQNHELRREVAALAAALAEFEDQQEQLLERLRQFDLEGTGGGRELTPTLINDTQAHVMRRRRLRDQVTNYLRAGETLRDQCLRERARIEALFARGLLTETAYRRALAERGAESTSR